MILDWKITTKDIFLSETKKCCLVFRSPKQHNGGGAFGIHLDLVKSKLYIFIWPRICDMVLIWPGVPVILLCVVLIL